MARRYQDKEGLTIADLGISLEELRGDPLEFLAREGARLLLMVALEEEVTGFLGRGRYERGAKRGYRNGHRERRVSCGAGEMTIPVPRGGKDRGEVPLLALGGLAEEEPADCGDIATTLHRRALHAGLPSGTSALVGQEWSVQV